MSLFKPLSIIFRRCFLRLLSLLCVRAQLPPIFRRCFPGSVKGRSYRQFFCRCFPCYLHRAQLPSIFSQAFSVLHARAQLLHFFVAAVFFEVTRARSRSCFVCFSLQEVGTQWWRRGFTNHEDSQDWLIRCLPVARARFWMAFKNFWFFDVFES